LSVLASPSGAVTDPNAQIAFNFFVGKGLADYQAAGIVGNLQQESGMGIDPNAVQRNGVGHGIAQWSAGGRWDTDANDNVLWYAQTQSQSANSLNLQLAFIWYELNSFPAFGLATLQRSSDVISATVTFQDEYEACGMCESGTRIAYAQNVLSLYGTASPSPPVSAMSSPGLARFGNGSWTFYEANAVNGKGVTDQYVTWAGTLGSDVPLVGDWNGDGVDTPGLARFGGNTWTFYLTNDAGGKGLTDQIVTWAGTLGSDVPLVGDWNGDGKDSPGLARLAGTTRTYYLTNITNGKGVTDQYVTWASALADDTPFVGSW
jgi:hypothetical protein